MDNESFMLVVDNARRWFAQHQPLADRIARFHDGHAEAGDTRSTWTDMGWTALSVPEAEGGFDASMAQCFQLLRLAGSDARPEPLDLILMLGAVPALAPYMGGNMRLALADRWFGQLEFTDAAQTVLHGSSGALYGGHLATHALLPVVVKAQGACVLKLACVALDSPGVLREAVRLIDGRHTVRLRLQQAAVQVLDSEETTAPLADQVLDRAAAGLVADASGVFKGAFELTLDYLKQRRQFGRPLSDQQALQHRMADIFCDLQQMLALSERLAAEIDAQPAGPWTTLPIAKSFVGRRALRAAGQLIQVSGGIGMTEEYRLGHYYKRLHVAATLFGDAEHQLRRIAVRETLFAA
ncbi:acyl-CoA dehydrogenase family protein [Noviherbaspirillum saxi]|nr:acyl-CoA dehydrogenase [Noviherbaspirillum saxi]